MRCALSLVVVVAACGRLHFDPLQDAAPDVPDAGCGHTFCDDFARTAPVVGPWDTQMLLGGTLGLEQEQLVADIAAAGDRAFLVKQLPQAATSVHVEADVEFASGATGEIDLIQIHWVDLPPPCTSFGYFLVRDRTGVVEMQETYGSCGGSGNLNDLMPSFPPSAPSGQHHVTIDVTLGAAGTAHLRAQVDATADVDQAITAYDVPASRIEIHLGEPGASNNGAWSIHYDNVVVDLQ